jgi:dihydroflavonol-4-reductase
MFRPSILPAAQSIAAPISEMTSAGIPKTPCTYVISKREAESVVRLAIDQQGLPAVIIHPGFMLGPYDWKPSSGRMMLEVSKAPLAISPAGGCSLCDARDVASGIVNSVERGRLGQAYILAGENLSYRELWTRMLKTAGKQKVVTSPKHLLNFVSKTLDLSMKWLPIPEGDINGAAIAMGQLNHYYDSSKAQRELDYSCRPSSQTLSEAWEWLCERAKTRMGK